MTTKITWKVLNLKRQIESGYVYHIDFAIIGSNDYHSHQMNGALELPRPANLVPYAELTQTVALKWIQDKINAQHEEDKTRNLNATQIEDQVKAIIKEKTEPTLGDGIPWS